MISNIRLIIMKSVTKVGYLSTVTPARVRSVLCLSRAV
jgi:hypothetical protein